MSPSLPDSQTPDQPRRNPPLLHLIVVLAACFILITISFTAWDSYKDRQTLIRAAEIQTQGYARALKEHAERAFSEVDLVLRSTLNQFASAGGPDKITLADQQRLLAKCKEFIPQIATLSFVDHSGQLKVSSSPHLESLPNVANRPFYQFHRDNRSDQLFINPTFMSRASNQWRFTLSRRVETPSGAFAGILIAAIDISYFMDLYNALASDRNARYSLATIAGDYLVLVPRADHVYATGKKTNEAFRQRVARAPTQTYHPEKSNVFGEPRITSYHRLDRYPVVAIMSFNKNHVLANWRTENIKTALTTGVFVVLLLFLTLQLMKQVRLLDHKVHERTAQLSLANRFLEDEVEERKQIETRLLEHQHKLEQMSADLTLAEDRERGRIAGELHDQVGQRLILAKIKLDELKNDATTPETGRLLTDTGVLIDQSIQDIRTLTFQMRPPLLANAGLLSALRWLGEELQRDYGLEVKCDWYEYGCSQEQLRYEISSALFQIVRELLLNVVKHAAVTTAWLSLNLTSDLLLIRITDNGAGFDLQQQTARIARQGGFGLYNIQQKITHLGGSCLFDTAPGMGTCVTLSLPLRPELFKETHHEPADTAGR